METIEVKPEGFGKVKEQTFLDEYRRGEHLPSARAMPVLTEERPLGPRPVGSPPWGEP